MQDEQNFAEINSGNYFCGYVYGLQWQIWDTCIPKLFLDFALGCGVTTLDTEPCAEPIHSHPNICSAEKHTKCSSVLLLRLVYFSAEQTLYSNSLSFLDP